MITTAFWRFDFVLAFIQGLTEIFPISSSGHLVVLSKVFGNSLSFGQLLFFHLGTFSAILVRYRKDIWGILAGQHGRKLPMYLLAAFSMTALVGLLFRNLAERVITTEINIIPYMWVINGFALIFIGTMAPQGNLRVEQLRLQDFLMIGLFQGITAIPGISRLGITLGVGLLIGLIWIDALKLSFILSLPTILFANLYEFLLKTAGDFSVAFASKTTTGLVSLTTEAIFTDGLILIISFTTGILALNLLSSHLSRKLLAYFGLYCLGAGMFFIAFLRLL